MVTREFVFGYGSLARYLRGGPATRSRGRIAHLRGYNRAWNVAMDNARDLSGYKFYRRPSGARPSVFVTFLNVVRGQGRGVNGVLLPVNAADLVALDARERNYHRTDVTAKVVGAPPGRVWTYVGQVAAELRYERGIASNRAVISRAYYERVVRDFARLGTRALVEFAASTEAPSCPIVDLTRVDLAPAVAD